MVAGKHLVWVTAAGQAVDHAVTSRGLASAVGPVGTEVLAVCGQRFWAAPLIADPGQPCAPCRSACTDAWRSSRIQVVAAQVTAPMACRSADQPRRLLAVPQGWSPAAVTSEGC